jgi:hypothetical protein
LPAIAYYDEVIPISANRVYRRKAGEALSPEREPLYVLDALKLQIGSDAFSAQYQQSPAPPGGAMAVASAKFEAGQVLLPERATWLQNLEAELFAFPGSQHDDQCDSISQALLDKNISFMDWLSEARSAIILKLRVTSIMTFGWNKSHTRGPRKIAVAGNRGHLLGEQHRIETRTKRNHPRINSGRLTIGGNFSRSPLAVAEDTHALTWFPPSS